MDNDLISDLLSFPSFFDSKNEIGSSASYAPLGFVSLQSKPLNAINKKDGINSVTILKRLKELHPYLVSAYHVAVKNYKLSYPDDPRPFVSVTFRSNEEQNRLYRENRDATNADAGKSLHNYLPSFAFDIAFISKEGKLDESISLFKKFADIICKDQNIEWSGNWKSLHDYDHFEFKGFTWRDAAAGKQPVIK